MVNELTQAPTFPVFRVVEGIAVVMASDGLWLLFHRLRWNVSRGRRDIAPGEKFMIVRRRIDDKATRSAAASRCSSEPSGHQPAPPHAACSAKSAQ